tara:strand:+ start:914 stop:1771 length:858 start_codon:yes stop_codon:yes gene_type:complete
MKRLGFIASLPFALMALPVNADAPPVSAAYNYQEMQYEVYAGGINVVRADMNLDFRTKGRYSMFFDAETRGFLGSVVPWSGSFETRGWAFKDGRRLPELHESIAMWREEREVKTYNYGKDGSFKDLTTTYVGKKPKKETPEKALVEGTTDALTATILVMEHVSDGGDCNGESEVYDGKRRYKLIFRHQQFVMLKKTRYNAYGGPAVECTVEVEPVAGAWHKKPRGWLSIQEQGRDRGMMPTVWMAQVTDNAVVVPVRVRVKTAYGTLFMHMKKYTSGETVLKAED